MIRHKLLTAALLTTALSLSAQSSPAPKAEMRAVWLTTNAALDWPSQTSDIERQKKELTSMLDKFETANFNTILFQVQAKGDVAWDSKIQPAMRYITGDGSKGLKYDVCRFVIDECHKRNMECHAWIVTYRIGTASEADKYKSNAVKHPYLEHPELCRLYNGAYYLDPGLPAVREYLVELYRELLTNYDFDGVNFDYTRYPGSDGFSTDRTTFANNNPENISNINDWRRWNINTFIADFYQMAKTVRPDVKVGCAPFGTYKNLPGYGNTTAYGSVYQDAAQWATSGHMDIVVPQMYWNEQYGFSPNMGTWVDVLDGHIFVVGLAPYKMVDGINEWDPSVVYDQIEKIRNLDGAFGQCYFRAEHVIGADTKVRKLYNELRDNYYKYPAHIPSMDFLGVTKPSTPQNITQEYVDGQYVITWDANPDADRVRYYTVYIANSDGTVDLDDPEKVAAWKVKDTQFNYTTTDPDLRFAVTAFDHGYYESDPAVAKNTGVDGVMASPATITYSHSRLSVNAGSRTIDAVDIYGINGYHAMSVPVNAESVAVECGDLTRGVYVACVSYADGGNDIVKIVR